MPASTATPSAINLKQKLSTFSDHWSPKIVSQFNGHDVMVVKVQGEFPWHNHPDSDDFFLVLDGVVTVETEHGNITLNPGELYIVPKGVQHRPRADQEACIMLIEPKGLPNTGDPSTAAQKVVI